MLTLSKRVLQVLLVLNGVAIAAFILFLALLFSPLAPTVEEGLAASYGAANVASIMQASALIMVLAIATGIAAHILFRRMLAIVGTAVAGDPFTLVNAARLRIVGWALLAIQFFDLGFGYLWLTMDTGAVEPFGWTFSVGGWISVLMVFVLARVFEQGSRMRDELAMTV